MGLLSKLLGGTTVVSFLLVLALGYKINAIKKDVQKFKEEISLKDKQITALQEKVEADVSNYNNTIRELQSIVGQINNKNKSLERENTNLRKGVRLDLLRVRVKRNGKPIDSTYQEAYKYLNK